MAMPRHFGTGRPRFVVPSPAQVAAEDVRSAARRPRGCAHLRTEREGRMSLPLSCLSQGGEGGASLSPAGTSYPVNDGARILVLALTFRLLWRLWRLTF